MPRFVSSILLTVVTIYGAAQTVNHNDVALIVNTNSQVSQAIGDRYQQRCNMPSANVIEIQSTTSETIDTSTFISIKNQIAQQMQQPSFPDSINYLVTTKGVPLKVARKQGCCKKFDIQNIGCCTSFDSEIALLPRGDSSLLNTFTVNNPYKGSNAQFTSAQYDMYLVTRLTGYTKGDVYDLISNSAANIPIPIDQVNNLIDRNYIPDSLDYGFKDRMLSIHDTLQAMGWQSTFDIDTAPVTNRRNLFLHYSVNRELRAPMNHDWKPGSLAELLFAPSATTFNPNNPAASSLQVADLIADGATGVHGYVSIPFLSITLATKTAMLAYIDTTTNYNLAESYYQGIQVLSGTDVVIGDPKTSVSPDILAGIVDTESDGSISVYPNPATDCINLSLKNVQNPSSVSIYNTRGQLVERLNIELAREQHINTSSFPSGVYLLQVQTENNKWTKRVVVQ